MQLIFVLTDIGDERLTYTVYEKKLPTDTMHSIASSPALQVGAAFSAFLKTIDNYHALLAEVVIEEEVKRKFIKGDFRNDLEKDTNIIRLDLNRLKPKGNA
ncbi:MAG: hypothetical protein RLZZ13_1003 [Pseudomonadota bacterium]|jgi:hypothetical protein